VGVVSPQTPVVQVLTPLQRLPSSQFAPSALTGLEQTPVDVLQVPALWHESDAVQTIVGVVSVHVPFWQLFTPLQALLSLLHDVPLATLV
jgi:hypothetical protein